MMESSKNLLLGSFLLALIGLTAADSYDIKIGKTFGSIRSDVFIGADPIVIKNPHGGDQFAIPKNYLQVLAHIKLVPNTKILFTNTPKKDKLCPMDNVPVANIDISTNCEEDVSCTMFGKIDAPFKFRAEQCAQMLYVLMIYPETNENPEDEVSISAEYIDNIPCYTVSGGVHEVVNSETEGGQRVESTCENTIRGSLITCEYRTEDKRKEKVCVPRVLNEFERIEYCARSGLALSDPGSPPLASYETSTLIIGVIVLFFVTCFGAGGYYNLRIYQKKKPPFRVPRFGPECGFPQPNNSVSYSFDNENESQNSFDVLDNQRDSTAKRGTTKYKAPQFYFEDE